MKNKYRNRLLLTVMLTLLGLACLLSACSSKSPIVGAWRLVESEDPAYAVGMIFEFKENGALNLLPGAAALSTEDLQIFDDLRGRLALSYQASQNGELRLMLEKTEGGSAVIRMNYAVEGDVLTITDENEVTLSFRRQ